MHSPDASVLPPEVAKAPEAVKPSRFERIKQPVSAKAGELGGKIRNFFTKTPKENPDVLLENIAGESNTVKISPLPEAAKAAPAVDTAVAPVAPQSAHHENIAAETELPVAKSEAVVDKQDAHTDAAKKEEATDASVARDTADTDAAREDKTEGAAAVNGEASEATKESADSDEEKNIEALQEVIDTGNNLRALQTAMKMMHHLKDPATLIGIGSVAVSLLATRFNTPIPPGVIERAASAIGGFAGGYSLGKDKERLTRLRNGAIGALTVTGVVEGLNNVPTDALHYVSKVLGVADDVAMLGGMVVKDKLPFSKKASPAPVPTQ